MASSELVCSTEAPASTSGASDSPKLLDDLANALLFKPAGSEQRGGVGRLESGGDGLGQRSWFRASRASSSMRPTAARNCGSEPGRERQPAVGGGGGNREARLGVDKLAAESRRPWRNSPNWRA